MEVVLESLFLLVESLLCLSLLGVCPWLDCFDFVKFVDFSELVVEESSEFLSSLELDESFQMSY